ncbi:hypothetical protein [Jidongwangia harbinensis]|uniref:hypothetical protein n=1 Tax=Jidongwangia harbinensis TaxID=2878561 RepID=UPI001CD99B21|nr:hypothetical protein [Jidongwangia harbinensis]MCA2219128.1 hypothetical protein [Jidongwangia harbinensis]
MPDRRASAYLSSEPHDRRPELFRTAELNAAGWAAVGGLCVAGAAAGLALARLTGAPSWITASAGAAAAFAAVLAADRRKWAGMHSSYAWTDDSAEVQHIAGLLQRAGIDAAADADRGYGPSLRYLNRDHRRVARAFREAGLPPPTAR